MISDQSIPNSSSSEQGFTTSRFGESFFPSLGFFVLHNKSLRRRASMTSYSRGAGLVQTQGKRDMLFRLWLLLAPPIRAATSSHSAKVFELLMHDQQPHESRDLRI